MSSPIGADPDSQGWPVCLGTGWSSLDAMPVVEGLWERQVEAYVEEGVGFARAKGGLHPTAEIWTRVGGEEEAVRARSAFDDVVASLAAARRAADDLEVAAGGRPAHRRRGRHIVRDTRSPMVWVGYAVWIVAWGSLALLCVAAFIR